MDKCISFGCLCENQNLYCSKCGLGPYCDDCLDVHTLHEHPEEFRGNQTVDKWAIRFAIHSCETKEVIFTGEIIVEATDKDQALDLGIPIIEDYLKTPMVFVISESVEAF